MKKQKQNQNPNGSGLSRSHDLTGSSPADPKAWEYFRGQHEEEHGFIPSYMDLKAQELYSMFKSGRIYAMEEMLGQNSKAL